MKATRTTTALRAMSLTAVGTMILLCTPNRVLAHCDTTSGPVVVEARAAIEKGDVTPILKWVKPEQEAEIKAAFVKTLAVRVKSIEARELADQYFLETLVRLHRAGEGAPYTGIKDGPLEPIAAMADAALADGSANDMIDRISQHMAKVIQERFGRAVAARQRKDESVNAGRAFVEAYVAYMHLVEGIHDAIVSAPGHTHAGATDAGLPGDEHGSQEPDVQPSDEG